MSRRAAIGDRLARHVPALAVAALLAYSIGLLGWSATRMPFWYDELLTVRLSNLEVGELRRALAAGFDLNPPLLYLVTRTTRALPGPDTLTARLPALAGYALLVVSLFAFLRRRVGAWFALAAVGLLALAPYTIQYSVEARAYMLLLGVSGCALACWQRMADACAEAEATIGRRHAPLVPAAGLTLTVGAALLLHVWAILLPAALLLGEVAAVVRRRRVRWWIVGALAAAGPALAFYPELFHASRNMVLATSVYEPSPEKLARALESLVPRHRVLASVLVLAGVAGWWLRRRARRDATTYRGLEPEEWVVFSALAVSPLAPYVYAELASGAFMARYVMYGLPALAGLAGGVLFHVGMRQPRAGIASAAAAMLGVFLYLPPKLPDSPWRTAAVESLTLVRHRLEGTLPVVPSNPIDVMHLDEQAEPSLRQRVLYVADPDRALAITGTNGVDLGYILGEPYLALRVRRVSYETLTRDYTRFYLVGRPHVLSWLPRRLEADGWRVRELGGTQLAPLFEATGPAHESLVTPER